MNIFARPLKCVHTSLEDGLSVRPSVCRSVRITCFRLPRLLGAGDDKGGRDGEGVGTHLRCG